MAEGCTFVASPFKPSHCKLCFAAKVDHKIPTLKTVEVKPVTQKSTDPTPTPTETKPVKTYKYQTNPQPVVVESTPTPVETKPVKTYKYQTNPQPVTIEKPLASNKYAITESIDIVEDKEANPDNQEQQIAPKKVFKPVGGVIMQGFDPRMLAGEALKRRAKKNLDEGALEASQGKGSEPENLEALWEPVPQEPIRPIGPNLTMLAGAGLQAALQKRKLKEEAAEALSNPNSASGSVIEETVEVEEVKLDVLPKRMQEVMARIDEKSDVLPSDDIVNSEQPQDS